MKSEISQILSYFDSIISNDPIVIDQKNIWSLWSSIHFLEQFPYARLLGRKHCSVCVLTIDIANGNGTFSCLIVFFFFALWSLFLGDWKENGYLLQRKLFFFLFCCSFGGQPFHVPPIGNWEKSKRKQQPCTFTLIHTLNKVQIHFRYTESMSCRSKNIYSDWILAAYWSPSYWAFFTKLHFKPCHHKQQSHHFFFPLNNIPHTFTFSAASLYSTHRAMTMSSNVCVWARERSDQYRNNIFLSLWTFFLPLLGKE